MNAGYLRKRRHGHTACYQYGTRLLPAVLAAVCLSGCGAASPDQGGNPAGQTYLPSDQAKHLTGQNMLKPGIQSKSPDIPYSDQVDTIIRNKDTWCFTMPADAGEEYGYDESDYYYWVTDLDQNGYLEVISSTTTGNGSIFYNEYYEVSRDGKNLMKLSADEDEDAPSPDLWNIGEYSQGYYDGKTGTYHYPQPDHTHSSALDTSDAQLDTVLSGGKVIIDTISYIESKSLGEPWEEGHGCVVEYYAGARAEKLGEVRSRYDEEKQEFISEEKQESEYGNKLEKLYEQYYEGMQEFTVTSCSFRNIDEQKYGKPDQEIEVVSDETLRKRVEESWNSFGIHVLNEKNPDNPFLPRTAAGDTEVKFKIDLTDTGTATMRIQEEIKGNQGVLYQATVRDPQNIYNELLDVFVSDSDDKDAKALEKGLKRRLKAFYFYLWVTDSQIYYIPDFYSYTEEDGDLDIIADETDGVDEHQKVRLVFYNELPEYARLVCQEEEREDALKEMELGEHQWIEKYGEDIRSYHAYTFRGEGYESSSILQLVWKRNEGLIGVRTAAHPAGGDSQLFWKEPYLKEEDTGFSIDHDTDG